MPQESLSVPQRGEATEVRSFDPKLDRQKCQSLVFCERSQLSQAILQFHLGQMLHERTPIAQCELQHHERRVYLSNFLFFLLGGRGM